MFQKVDDNWPRWEHFHHYMDTVRCTYSLTVPIDVTILRRLLKERGLRAYPAQIYLLARAVNRFDAFRMGLTPQGEPGVWDMLHPAYTILNAQTETFSSIWTPYAEDFSAFYDACLEDMNRFAGAAEFMPKRDAPPNLFDISSVPWLDFTAFNLNIFGEGRHMLPIFTIGRYGERDGRTLMPLAMQLHHAACDGIHAGKFVKAVREMAEACEEWM